MLQINTIKITTYPVDTGVGKGKGTRYLTSEVLLLSREYSPRKPTVRSFYPPLSISAPLNKGI